MTALLFWMIGIVVLVLAVDRSVGLLMHMLTPYLPDEFCGPDGWLVDTKARTGVFD